MQNTVYLVVETAVSLATAVCGSFLDAGPHHQCMHSARIPGRGYAYALMQELNRAAKEHGADAMSLEVRVSNRAALKLYKKCGFSIHGIRKRYYSNNGEDAYVMWTERGPGLEAL